MALDILQDSAAAREIFSSAQRTLGYDIAEVCKGADELLDLTEFTQPCILTAEIAMYEAIKAKYSLLPRYFGGHSLGEYTALVAAGAMPLEVALKIVQQRGRLMQKAVAPGVGLMVALIQEQVEGTEEAPSLPWDEIRRVANAEGVDIANENSPSQVILSGLAASVERTSSAFQEWERQGQMRIVPLRTSAPFHSRHMKAIEPELRAVIEAVRSEIQPEASTHVVSNYTGKFHTGKLDDLIDALVFQASGPVRWRENMDELTRVADTVLEIGPDRPLRSFFLAIGVSVTSVTDQRTLARAFPGQKLARA